MLLPISPVVVSVNLKKRNSATHWFMQMKFSRKSETSWSLKRPLLSVSRSDFGVVRRPRQRRLGVHRRRRGLLRHQRPGRDGRRGRRRRGRGRRQRRIPVIIFFFFLKEKKESKKKVKRANCFIWSNCTFLGDFPGRFLIVLTAYGLLSVYRLFYSKEKKKKKKREKQKLLADVLWFLSLSECNVTLVNGTCLLACPIAKQRRWLKGGN